MFDLEKSVSEWRKQMLAAGIQSPVPLEELELHLREEIERRMKSGMDEQQAFEFAVQKMGTTNMLKSEFRKMEGSFMKMIPIFGGFLLGVTMQLPGSFELRDQLVMADGRLVLWLLGFFLQMWAMGSLWRRFRPGANKFEFEKFTMSFSRIVKTGAGVAVLLGGMMFLIPAGIQAGREGLVKFDALCWLVFGMALAITGFVIAFCPYKKARLEGHV